MKKLIYIVMVLAFFSCNNKFANFENQPADYAIIPLPNDMTMQKGRFIITPKTSIKAADVLKNEATYLQELLADEFKTKVKVGNESGKIKLQLNDSIKSDEGYQLNVTPKEIVIEGKTTAGVFYGIQTLRQLIAKGGDNEELAGKLSVPDVKIIDEPRFSYRGMHLDVGRHFFNVNFIKKYIDLIALHKMNKFHWHLTEDQGWRIEIKKYPKLTEIGSIREETMTEKNFNPYKGDGKEYGGFYTQEEVKDIVAYAKKRHITVIPEIELPGHSLAALAAYPELGNGTGPYKVATKWGVFEQIYAPKEETFKFLENVLTEVMTLFPSKYIHIGGDEAPKAEWKKSRQAQKVIRKNKLKDEHELQSYFIQRIEKFLNSKGRQIIGWDEILEGGLAPNATVMSWRGIKGGIEAAKQKHNVVMTPGTHCYLDHYQSKDKGEPLAIGGFTSVEKIYSYEPIPKELSKDEEKYILGAQGNVWTEYIKTPKHVEYMVLPRMTALSEVLWSNPDNKDWENFKNRLDNMRVIYDKMDTNYAKHVFE